MNLLKFNFYKNESEELQFKKLEIHNELRDLIKSSNSFTYYHIYNFYLLHIDYVSIQDLFKNMIMYGCVDGLDYLYKEFNKTNINYNDYFYPFYSYLLNSVKNINNICMYQYIFEKFNHIKPFFMDFILAINHGNIEVLNFLIHNFQIVEPNKDEINNFDIKEFLEKIKKGNVIYIQIVFDVIQHSDFLKNEIINNIGKKVDFDFISKKYFIEAIMKSMIDNNNTYGIHKSISYSYNA